MITSIFSKSRSIQFLLINFYSILFFSFVYFIHYLYDKDAYHFTSNTIDNKEITYLDFLHFSLVTQSTVGYGEIIAHKRFSKIINSLHIMTIFMFLI